jgi:hypothetical protein
MTHSIVDTSLRLTRRPRFGRWAALLLLLVVRSSWAQSGSVNGHIVDPKGAVVQGAQVTITGETTTKDVEAVQTNQDGYFLFPPLTPGSYVIHVHADGFAEETIDKVILEVAGSRTFDLTLKPEGTTTMVLVSAGAPELVVDSPDRGNVIESRVVQNTPLNIRNPLQLVNFAQGVTSFSGDSGNNDASESYTNTFRINGGKLATTESLLDGGANTTLYDLNAIASVPTVDAIQEFKVLTSPYAAEWGRTSGGIVTFAQKSGADRIHGSAFEYIRNSYTDANSFNADGTGTAKPHFERNQFGYEVGGPVTFPPHYLHDTHRTFFYTTYEGLRQSQEGSFTYTVPTALERQGDFSQTKDASGNLIVIYDPRSTALQPVGSTACSAEVTGGQTVYCRTPLAGNKIPSSELDPVGQALLNSYPAPNQAGVGASSVNNFFSAAPTSSIQNTVNFRIDHTFTEKQSIFAHFDWFQRWNYFGDPYGNGLSPTSNHQRLPGMNVMLDHTWVLSSNLVFEHHFVYAHQESNRSPESLGYDPTKLGFNSSVSSSLVTTTFPAITAATRLSALGPQSGKEADGGTTFQYAGSFSWLKGKHTLKFGYDFRVLEEDYNINQLLSISASSNFTGGANPSKAVTDSGSGAADLLLGAATVTSGISPGIHVDHLYYAGYAQDEYHLTPKLTVTYGLRYSLELPDQEKKNQFPYLDVTSTSPLSSQISSLGNLTGGLHYVGVNGTSRHIQTAQTANLDPRLGFAYSWDDKTVVRAGFGIFHAPSLDATEVGTNYGFGAVTVSNPTQANGVTPLFNLDNPFPNGLLQPSGNSLGLATDVGLSISGTPRQQVISYSEQWSADVQRALPGNFVVTAGYVGNHGVHLYAPFNYNQLSVSNYALGSALGKPVANPFHGIITTANSPLAAATVQQGYLLTPHPQFQNMLTTLSSIGDSSYNALQLSVEHRFSRGLAGLFNYTHGHMVDDVGDYENDNQLQNNYCIQCEKSISNQDVRNVLRLSAQYEFPFGQGKQFTNQGWLSPIVGGWTFGSFYTYDDGLPVQVVQANDPNLFGAGSIQRPNASGISPAIGSKFKHIYNQAFPFFNPAAFTPAAPYTFGNAPRYNSAIRAPGANNWDMLLSKRIPLVERYALTFSFQAFNAFNRIQFAGPTPASASVPEPVGTTCIPTTATATTSSACSTTSNFGNIVVSQASSTYSRSLQASLRLSF